MTQPIAARSNIELGFIPTHATFLGALVPGDDGKLVRSDNGEIAVVDAVKKVLDKACVKIHAAQIPVFPGTQPEEWDTMIPALKDFGLNVHLVMMLGDVDPSNPGDADEVISQLVPALEAAKRHGVAHVSSTSIETWMKAGATRKDGDEFTAAIEQVASVHARIDREVGLADSCVEAWHIEFLRPGEFQTFTDLGRLWQVIKRCNDLVERPFFKCLVDAAHCGDSGLGIEENQQLIEKIAAAGDLGIMHASAKTTRGCLSTDDGWVAALLSAGVRSGNLQQVFVEMFSHEDEVLEGLRKLDSGHGVDTTDGRDYPQVVADGLETVTRYLNNYVARGFIPASS